MEAKLPDNSRAEKSRATGNDLKESETELIWPNFCESDVGSLHEEVQTRTTI